MADTSTSQLSDSSQITSNTNIIEKWPQNLVNYSVKQPKYKVIFDNEELEEFAHPEYTHNFLRKLEQERAQTDVATQIWSTQKAEIIISGFILVTLLVVLVYTINYYRRRLQSGELRFRSETSSDNNNNNLEQRMGLNGKIVSQTTSDFSTTSSTSNTIDQRSEGQLDLAKASDNFLGLRDDSRVINDKNNGIVPIYHGRV